MTTRRYTDDIVADWHRRAEAGETARQIAADHPGVTRDAVLGAIHRYRIKINGPSADPPQRRKRAEGIRKIMSDQERREVYGGLRYENISREFLDNTPIYRTLALVREVESVMAEL
jgi:hypothetical protein